KIKMGFIFISSGMFKEAAELYYQAAVKKPNKVELKIDLKRSGQMYIESLALDIGRASSRGDHQAVVYNFLEMRDFEAKAKRVGVELRIDHNTQRMYETSQDTYLEQRYEYGQKLLGEQNFDEAKQVFTEIQNINPDYRDTQSYLNTATLEPLYQSGTRYFSQRNYMQAYKEWEKVSRRDPNYKDVRQRMEQALSERYKEGTLLLINEDFDAAAEALGDVYNVNPGYLDVRVQYIQARNEPVYRQANRNLREGKCRTAYFGYEQILDDAGGNYKEAATYRNQALECAAFPIAIHSNRMPGNTAVGADFENVVIQQILDTKDPFIKIHRLPALNQRIHRSFLSTTGALNKNLLRELHDRHGIKAVLVVNFSHYHKSGEKVERKEKTGFERLSFTSEAGEIAYRDRQVKYNEFRRMNQIDITMNLQLISTTNGEILLSQRFNQSEKDEANYATYDGETKNLYPAYVRNDSYLLDERRYSSLQQLLTADRDVASSDTLRERLFEDISNKISSLLVNYNPEQ
ncbi:MAG: tetratricopeptide repeat protein, partial [Bacteroidota bacterium]